MAHKKASGFLQSVLQNGVGRYVCQLQRITLQFSKTSASSKGARDYIEQEVIDFANKHPEVVLYVTPHNKYIHPRLVAEYLNGSRNVISISNFDIDQVKEAVELARCQSGREILRTRKPWQTYTPSIQGVWNPFLNKPTNLNIRTVPSDSPTDVFPKKQILKGFPKERLEELAVKAGLSSTNVKPDTQ
ncbi:39S ribosomal protein L43, mitochondrial-like [Anneissia japonica]|uniref:39S ribosomal protein L43, mitochondrial-like n=1 Tax=Anneissia japonica TaxID=1529436 RepID=UPI001425B176|nr:39S ribosomal protein L43, mitochondrial-like [Anneissia japonica]